MKTKFFRISKQSVSILLSILMVVSMMLVGMVAVNAAYTDPHFYLIGGFTGNNWDSNQSGYAINKGYGQNGKFYIEVNVPSGTSSSNPVYFALWNGSSRYAPATQHTNMSSNGLLGDYDHAGNSWIYTGSASKIKICVDQRSENSDDQWRPYVWIEETSTPPASSNWYLSGYLNKTDIGNGNSSYKFSSTSTANVYELEVTFSSAHNNGQYITINNGSTVYGSSSNDKTLNENATDTGNSGNGNKWFAPIPANTKVKFTWNAATNTISWSKVTTTTTYTVTVSAGSNGSAYITSYTNSSGSVVTNASTSLKTVTVKSGTTVTMKAVPNTDYSVATWNGASSTSTTYTTGSITSNTTISVTFSKTGGSGESGSGAPAVDKSSPISGVYLIYSTSNDPGSMTNYIQLYKVNGEAIAYFSEDVTNFKAGTTYYFALTSVAGGSTAYQSMYWQSWAQGSYTSFNVTKNNADLFESCGTQDYNRDNKAYKFPTFRVSAITQDVQISVGNYGTYVEGNTYDIRAYSSLTKAIKIYAKDGTIRTNYQKYSHIADTTFSDETNLFSLNRDENQREEAYADLGTTITVQTTIESAYKSKYYVRAFCVNGESYNIIKNTQADTTNGVYTLTYTIPEDFEDDKIEITPIYFYINEEDTITFYVEGFDSEVKEKWGDTIACHAYYEGIADEQYTDVESGKNALGGYPGQPMVYEGGKYYMQIPKKLNGNDDNSFKGITLNNFVWDDVHAGRAGGTGNNCQTYDYNDLYCIANIIEDVDNIIFRFKYETKHDNDPGTYPTDSNKTSVYTNGWEDLVDYNGDKVDLFGKVLTDTEANRQKLRIVSNGYAYNHIGKYATEWTVYQGSGSSWTKVGTLPSSVLLYPTSADIPDAAKTYGYDGAYTALEAYRGYPAEITYEKSITGGNDVGNRADGRWYYSFKGEEITANTRIEYAPTLDDEFVEDPFVEGTATGTTTGTKAYFTNAGYEYMTVANGIIDPDSYFEFSAEESVNYMFVGWWLLQDGKYTKFAGRNLNETASMSSNATYVARFIEVPEGRMTVTHRLFTEAPVIDENTPQAHDGSGTCYVKVEVLDSSNNVIYTYDETTGAILIREDHLQATSTNKLRITLRTKMDGLDKFYAYYVNNLDTPGGYYEWTTDANRGATGQTTRELNFNVSELFHDPDNDGIPEFFVDSLDFYSDIEKVTVKSDITYRYFARYDDNLQGNNKVGYVVSDVELSKDEINNNDCKLSYDTLRQYAPSVDTLYVDTQWVFNEDTVTYDTVNNKVYVDAVQQTKVCRVVTPDLEALKDDPSDVIFNEAVEVPYNTWYADGDGEFLLIAPETIGDLKFNRWEVYNIDEQDNNTGELVTVLATERFTLRIMDDYIIVPVYSGEGDVITAHISPPVFNREVFGDSTNPTDRLYVDFLTAFTSQHIPVFNENESEYTVECGMIVDRNNDLALSAEDRSDIIDAATGNAANPLNMDTYKAQFGTDYDTIYNVAFDSSKVDKDKVTYDDANGREHRLTKYVFDNEQLTNKNRIDKVLVYTNNEANQNYIFAAYSYVIIRDIEGNVVASTLTAQEDAQFYNLCYTGHMPASVAA